MHWFMSGRRLGWRRLILAYALAWAVKAGWESFTGAPLPRAVGGPVHIALFVWVAYRLLSAAFRFDVAWGEALQRTYNPTNSRGGYR